MTPFELIRHAAEKYGYKLRDYLAKEWGTDELIFVGPLDCPLYTLKEGVQISAKRHFSGSGIRFNPSFRLDIFPMVSWEMDENDIEYIFGAQTRKDFETRIEAYLAISIALGRTEEEKR